MVRKNNFNFLHHCKDLFQQYLVDQFVKVETERLFWIRTHQSELRAQSYAHLKDALSSDTNLAYVGKRCILPSTFTGGPRYMHEKAQDAMAYVRKYGRPDLFITFTCNSKWPEIINHLLPNQHAKDRPDIVARVFHQKIRKFSALLSKGKLFGKILAKVHTIEWQKRGLPHCHSLLWLEKKITPDMIDDVVSAQIPDPELDPKLFEIVKSTMVHGPCGKLNPKCSCMNNNSVCSKRFPRQFVFETQTGHDGYPLYKRLSKEQGGHEFTLVTRSHTFLIDNRWIVPYNPVLLRIFNAHINVEIANSIKAIKYVCKYVYKGSDLASYRLAKENKDSGDEVTSYEVGRYISSHEASWRLFSFNIHDHFPPVEHLNVHLENGERVLFKPTSDPETLLEKKETKLTGFFELCKSDPYAKTLMYTDIPTFYIWNSGLRKWKRRKMGIQSFPGVYKAPTVARMYTVHPNQHECFFLRMLLTRVRGPTSFESLRTVRSEIHATFREACIALGLLENDDIWINTLENASQCDSPHILRTLFVVILVHCYPSDALCLWRKFANSLSEDITHKLRKQFRDINAEHIAKQQTLTIIGEKLKMICGKSLSDFKLPVPNTQSPVNHALARELCYDNMELSEYIAESTSKLNHGQRAVYETVMESVNNNKANMFFIDAPGGTGKTFVLQLLLAKIRATNHVALAVASSGIAATMLTGGRTAHSTFKLPLNVHPSEVGTCGITLESDMAEVLRRSKIIIWDEVTMSHRSSLEAVDLLLRDVTKSNCFMGGKTVVFSGDFRQTLPVIQKGTKADQLRACVKTSLLWNNVIELQLEENMRCKAYGEKALNFAKQLLLLGEGSYGETDLTAFSTVVQDESQLQECVFPDLHVNYKNISWLTERCILAATNNQVQNINAKLASLIPGESCAFLSIDTTLTEEDAVQYPTEFLNSLSPNGIPPHILILKIGLPVMILRNLDPPNLCNGTRCVVKTVMQNVIEVTPITGPACGKNFFIPRIPLIPTDLPFRFKRLQFPLKICFSMTINKSQGQTFKSVGLHLLEDCFSHGQLYVAASRVGSPENLFAYLGKQKTKNIVYVEALN